MKNFKMEFNSICVGAKSNLLNNLKSFYFTKISVKEYSNSILRSKKKIEFDIIPQKFSLSKIKPSSKIKPIDKNSITDFNNNIIDKHLTDSILTFNLSIFETWIFDLIRLRIMAYPKSFNYNSSSDDPDSKSVPIKIIKNSTSIDELWQRIIDDYIFRIGYTDIEKHIELLFQHYKISIKKKDLIGRIKEFSLRRNVLIHNKKIVGNIYINKSGLYAKYKLGDKVILTDDDLFEQTDNYLRFITDFSNEFSKG
ncbi:MAG: hypothetical protein MUP85_16340 [Candidatus Lokiarchaeota archaeon]|nr:hypothetical protein [Candidatus Lokiarchaeota archaeon]